MAVCFTRIKISLGYGLVKHIVSSQNPILGLLVSYRSLFLNICNFYIVVFLQDTSMLLIGGLMMALAVEKCQLHARIALKILLLFGTRPVQ